MYLIRIILVSGLCLSCASGVGDADELVVEGYFEEISVTDISVISYS